MDTEVRNGAVTLDADECWRLLADAPVGRLALSIASEPEIFPVNHVVDGYSLVFRTGEGTKLFGVAASPRVAFEVDGFDAGSGEAWSVVAKGTAQRLERFSDIYAVDELPLRPWQTGVKQWFVRIADVTVTGIRFTVRGDGDDGDDTDD